MSNSQATAESRFERQFNGRWREGHQCINDLRESHMLSLTVTWSSAPTSGSRAAACHFRVSLARLCPFCIPVRPPGGYYMGHEKVDAALEANKVHQTALTAYIERLQAELETVDGLLVGAPFNRASMTL